jgi:hypothetical protein
MTTTLQGLRHRIAARMKTSEMGLTTLEYVIGAGIILVVLAAGILAWNTGLVDKIGQLVTQLLSG